MAQLGAALRKRWASAFAGLTVVGSPLWTEVAGGPCSCNINAQDIASKQLKGTWDQDMVGAKKAKSKGKVTSSLKGSEGRAAKTGNPQSQVSRIGCCNAKNLLCMCTDEVATDAAVWLPEQGMLLLQAQSVEADARARIARIQPFWKTLSAHSRMNLLSVPVAAAKQCVAAAKAEHRATEVKAQQGRDKGTKRCSASKRGAPALLQLQCRTCQRLNSLF